MFLVCIRPVICPQFGPIKKVPVGDCRRARDLLSFNDDVIGLLKRQGDIWWQYQELCGVSLFYVYHKKPHIFEFIYFVLT